MRKLLMVLLCLFGCLATPVAATGLVDNSYDPTKLPHPLPYTYNGTTYYHAIVWPHTGSNDHWVAYYNDPLDWLSSPTMILLPSDNACFYQASPSPGGGAPNATCGAVPMYTNECTRTYYADVNVLAGGNGTLWGSGSCGNINFSTNDILIGGIGYSITTAFTEPMSGFSGRTALLDFGDDWTFGECPSGTDKKHAGLDVSASNGEDVFAAHTGVVTAIFTGDHATWGDAIVVEDNSGTFTTVYWHVSAFGGLAVNDPVTAGQKIATIANLGGNTHFHFGIRAGAYSNPESYAGALPVTSCGGYGAFPEDFVDPAAYTYN